MVWFEFEEKGMFFYVDRNWFFLKAGDNWGISKARVGLISSVWADWFEIRNSYSLFEYVKFGFLFLISGFRLLLSLIYVYIDAYFVSMIVWLVLSREFIRNKP